MSSIAYITQKPLILGLKHFGFGLLSVGAISSVGAGAIQIAGNEKDIGPKVEIAVPVYHPPKANEAHNTVTEVTNKTEMPKGLFGMMGWNMADGGMTPWNRGEHSQTIANESHAPAQDPHVITPAEAASAPPADAHGEAKIITAQMGSTTDLTTIEGGVKVMRSNVQGGGSPLVPAPIAGVQSSGPNGQLPAIASDGRTPFEVYRRPFNGQGTKVALIVGGLGLNARITERAINQLPAEVTLSFVPNADNLQAWVNKARAQGHEVMIEVPMEPFDYPDNDPGPQTLMASGDWGANQSRVEYILSRTTGYFAVTNYMGGRFAGSGNSANFMKYLKNRGVGFISDGSAPGLIGVARSNGVKSASADRNIDARPSAADIEAQLGALEASAKQKGSALGFGIAYSVTIDQIINWLGDAKTRGITLAPASSVAG